MGNNGGDLNHLIEEIYYITVLNKNRAEFEKFRTFNYFILSAKLFVQNRYKQAEHHCFCGKERELLVTEVELAAKLETETVGFG